MIFLTGFFGNWLVDYQIIPPWITLVTELSIYLLFCIALVQNNSRRRGIKLDLFFVYAFFVFLAVISAAVNRHFDLSLIVGLRFVLRFYVLYLAFLNLDLGVDRLKKINVLLFVLFVLQLPAVAIRFAYWGISERTIGTYAGHGGGLTPVIPIVAIGYLSGLYIFLKKNFLYLLLIIGFVLLGIAGEKRVLFFLYPVAFMGIYYLGYFRTNSLLSMKLFVSAIAIIVLVVMVQFFMMQNIRTLNPEQTYGDGSVNYKYVWDYAKKYESSEYYGRKGSGGGRISTTIVAFKTVLGAGFENALLGFGPGTVVSSVVATGLERDRRLLAFNNSYGKTGFAYVLVEYGILGAILISYVFLVFMRRSYRWFEIENDPYMKALALGTVVFAFLQAGIYFMYNRVPINDDTIVPVYFYAMAFMYRRITQLFSVLRLKRNDAL